MASVVDSGRFIGGPALEAFERDFSAYLGGGECIGVSNGLDALTLILRAMNLGPGDEVVVPAYTFVATWLAVSNVGARPVAAEPCGTGLNASAQTIAKRITSRTKAIVLVHMTGAPVDVEPIRQLARIHNLRLVEDAAQAHGASRDGEVCGRMAEAAAFSFYPGKNLGAFGDAGMVATGNETLAERIRRLRNYGAREKYDHGEIGFNMRLDPLQAAVLGVKLPHLDEWNARRQRVARIYSSMLEGTPNLLLPDVSPNSTPAWHLYVIRHKHRDSLQARLRDIGIETLVHYPKAIYRLPPYSWAAPTGHSPADAIAATCLSLPIGPHLRDEDAERVASSVRTLLRELDGN